MKKYQKKLAIWYMIREGKGKCLGSDTNLHVLLFSCFQGEVLNASLTMEQEYSYLAQLVSNTTDLSTQFTKATPHTRVSFHQPARWEVKLNRGTCTDTWTVLTTAQILKDGFGVLENHAETACGLHTQGKKVVIIKYRMHTHVRKVLRGICWKWKFLIF